MDKKNNITSILLGNEERLLRADVRKSAEELSALISDEFIEIGSSGRIYTREDVIETLKKEADFKGSISEFQAKQLSREIIVVTYRMVESNTMNAATPRVSVRSSIWKLMKRRWKLIFHQGTVSTSQ